MPLATRAALAAASLALLLAAPAGAATITDATGDADGDPGHDITRFDWSYDPSGTATGTITVAGAGADAGLYLAFSVANADGSCSQTDGAVLLGVKSIADPGAAQWAPVTGGAPGTFKPAQRSGSGQSYTLTAVDGDLAGKGYTCAEAQVTATSDTTVVYDGVSPQAATPTPTPAPAPVTPKPRLKLSVKGLKAVRAGRTTRPTLTLRNAGTAASKQTTLRLKTPRGVSVKPGKVVVKALKPGKAVTVKLRVAVSRRAKATNAVSVTAGAAKLTLAVKRSGIRKARPMPTPVKGGLPGSFWWWNVYSFNQPFDLYALRFYDNGYAYYRLPDDQDETAPATCTSVTAVADKDGDYGSGCVRWTLKGSRLTITDPSIVGTYAKGKLTIRKQGEDDPIAAERLVQPKPGTRLNVSYLHRDQSGLCGYPGQFCSTSKDNLTLQSDGQFGKASESLTTSGGTGTPFIAVGGYPPDKRGTYAILPGYRIRLDYADGTSKTYPFGVFPKSGKDAGLVLGQYNYYVEDD